MGVDEGGLQVVDYRSDKITIRYILSSSACSVCNSHYLIFVTA